MVQLGEYIQIISPIIYGGALIVSILQFSAMKKSMSSQSVQQAYASTTQLLFNNINSPVGVHFPSLQNENEWCGALVTMGSYC
jgi:hypothetical protein